MPVIRKARRNKMDGFHYEKQQLFFSYYCKLAIK